MSQLFDLNVQNYSLNELLDFFGLTQNSDAFEVERKCAALKQKINNDPKLGNVTKGKIHNFLDKATQRLSHTRATSSGVIKGFRAEDQDKAQQDKAPAQQDKAPAQQDKAPAQQDKAPAQQDKAPAQQDKAPAQQDKAPAQQDKAPAQQDKAPAQQDKAPAQQDKAPAQQDKAPAQQDKAPDYDQYLITRPSDKISKQQRDEGIEKGGKSILSGAPPGMLNRVAISTIKRALNIDTRFRASYYTSKSTDFLFTIPYKFENVISMSVASYELPLTYYAISQQYENNCILFQWESTPVAPPGEPVYDKQYIMLIPDGNYRTAYQSGGGAIIENTINGILAGTELSTQTGLAFTTDSTSGRSIFTCNSATDPSGNVLPYGNYYFGAMRIVFNVKGKTVQDNGNYSFVIDSDSRALPLFFGWKLGFRTAMYEMRGNTGLQYIPQAAVSEGICQISGPQYLFLCIDDFNNSVNNYYVSALGTSTISPNIIARLNIKQKINAAGAYGLAGGESLTTSLTYSREYFGPVDIQRMRITLVDDFGRVLDLNNMDWSFSLMFECVYSSSSA